MPDKQTTALGAAALECTIRHLMAQLSRQQAAVQATADQLNQALQQYQEYLPK